MRRLSVTQLAELLPDVNVQLLDVREPWEFDIGHIDGSINIPMGQIPQNIDTLSEDSEMVVICHHGIRSMQVINYLMQQGFDNLANLDGGVDAWAREVDSNMATY